MDLIGEPVRAVVGTITITAGIIIYLVLSSVFFPSPEAIDRQEYQDQMSREALREYVIEGLNTEDLGPARWR